MRILKIIKIKTEYIETLEESSDWAETPDKIGGSREPSDAALMIKSIVKS